MRSREYAACDNGCYPGVRVRCCTAHPLTPLAAFRLAGASGLRTCFKEIAWVWNLNTTVRLPRPGRRVEGEPYNLNFSRATRRCAVCMYVYTAAALPFAASALTRAEGQCLVTQGLCNPP